MEINRCFHFSLTNAECLQTVHRHPVDMAILSQYNLRLLTQLAKFREEGSPIATKQQIETLLAELSKSPPSEHFQQIDISSAGIRAILKYLSEISDHATAGKISKALGVSTARVTVLLKKMVAKGLLEKQSDPSDGRLVVVQLSQLGKDTADRIRNEMYAQLGTLIDQIGMERMMEFAEISHEIHSVMKKAETT